MKLYLRITRIITLVLVMLVLGSGVVLAAYSYQANIQVQETSSNSYTYLPIIASIDNDYLSANGYISLTGLDTRVLSGSTELKHMLSDNKTLFVVPSVGANSTENYKYTLGNTASGSFPIIVGRNGYITTADADALEPVDNFTIEQKGYVDVSSDGNKNLVYKQGAFKTYIGAAGSITSTIGGGFPTIAATNTSTVNTETTSHTVNLPSSIVSEDLLIVFFEAYSSTASPTVTWPSGWTQLFQTAHSTYYTFTAAYRVADGTEEATISVTTSSNSVSAHDAYRITGYGVVPEAGTTATGSNVTPPDPPSLAPSWGTWNTLWLAVTGYGTISSRYVTAYPTNYTLNQLNPKSTTANYPGVGSAGRQLNVASEDPGTFTLNGSAYWAANTIAIQGGSAQKSATVTGLSSGELIVKTTADGTNMTLSVTNYAGTHQGNSPQSVDITGVSVPSNGNNWYINQNNVIPYMEYYSHTTAVGGTSEKARYEPASFIIGTNLPNKNNPGTYNGTITWGSNPAGLSVTVDSLISSSQPVMSPAGEEPTPDVVPEGQVPAGGIVDTVKLQDNPLYPIVKFASDNTKLTEEQIWFGGATLIILLAMGLAVTKVPNHLFLAGIIGLACSGFFLSMGIYQWWMLLIFGFIFLASILFERKPVL